MNFKQFYQTQLKEIQMQMDSEQEQLDQQVMKTSRSNTLGTK
jgi:hypothetical protein